MNGNASLPKLMAVIVAALPANFVFAIMVAADEEPRPITDNEPLFKQLDADGNGAVTAAEVSERHQRLFKRLIRTADADGDGALSQSELRAGLQPQRPERPLEQIPAAAEPGEQPLAVFARLDKDRNGQLTEDELPAAGRRVWQQFLKNSDNGGDGRLNRFEFSRNYYRIASRVNPSGEQMDNMAVALFQRGDRDGDGKLTREETPADRRRQFSQMLLLADADEDRALSLEEFTKGMRQMQAVRAADLPSRDTKKTTDEKKPADSKKSEPEPENEVEQAVNRILQLDSNDDGKLDRTEARGPFAKNFRRMDADGSGALDRTELSLAARLMIRMRKDRRAKPDDS
ncbi:MAG: hypothetical protein VB853_05335 [Pirellulales bacterium]